MSIVVVLLVAATTTLSFGQLEDIHQIRDENITDYVPCRYKEFIAEYFLPLSRYGNNVCERKARYRESRKECVFRKRCELVDDNINCRMDCIVEEPAPCISELTTYTYKPTCCEGYASSYDAGLVDKSTNIRKLLKSEGCPIKLDITTKATCVMKGAIRGKIEFTQPNLESNVTISVHLEGLIPGPHGTHIHEYGDISEDCDKVGRHYQPFGGVNIVRENGNRRVFAGDLLNIIANENGTAVMSYDDHLIKLNGPISVIGKTFVVHAEKDVHGEAGSLLNCCTIGASAPDSSPPKDHNHGHMTE